MAKERKRYTREFKLEALELMAKTDKPIAVLERELGLSDGRLHHWKREFTEKGEEAFPGKGKPPATDEEIRKLRREITRLRQERDILKKALAIFSQERR